MSSKTPITPISYTNKDFQTIYPELLDVVKKLTYKWDPSISNESDPGVILLKLNAIIGDKNNYNIDKNVLENFPETLTQQVSARNIYKQLGYYMPWYRSSSCTVSFKWIGEELSELDTVIIPKYTMVTTTDEDIVYTLTQDVTLSGDNIVSSGTVLQGVINDLKVNGSPDIGLVNLDYNNRIYFDESSVAENGIFITNIGGNTLWTRVDNLQTQQRGQLLYEFGIDSRDNLCYVEFPDDIESIIGNGLNIKYLVSEGREGNISPNTIDSFYEDVTSTGTNTDVLNKDNCLIKNITAATDGDNPESISDAYKSYQKVAGTFNTLVTLRDYINGVYNTELVSNDVVSDRTNDLQSSFSVIVDAGDSYTTNTYVSTTTTTPDLDAFDLKLYLLQNAGVVQDLASYNKSFELVNSGSTAEQSVISALYTNKCIQHDFAALKKDYPCVFQIRYPISIKIVPQYSLTELQQKDVTNKILVALSDSLNARKVSFGKETSYDEIYDTILSADNRIKLVIMDDFDYTAYVSYIDDSDVIKTIPISWFAEYGKGPQTPYIIYINDIFETAKIIWDELVNTLKENINKYYFICNIQGTEDSTAQTNVVYKYNTDTKEFTKYSQLINYFRKFVIAKNVFAGKTPLFNQVDTFSTSFANSYINLFSNVNNITTSLTVEPFKNSSNSSATYTLRENESLKFVAPSLVTDLTYSTYVKYDFVSKEGTCGTTKSSADYSKFNSSQGTYNGDLKDLFIQNDEGTYTYIAKVNNATLDSRLTLNVAKPIYIKNKYYKKNNTEFILVTDDLVPEDWGTGNYYFAPNDSSLVTFNPLDYTYLKGWQTNEISVFIEVPRVEIPANTDYQLKQNEYITFFYKEKDEENSPYIGVCYKGTNDINSPIIRPSFELIGKTSSNVIDPATVLTKTYYYYSDNTNSTYQKISALAGTYDLSGTKSIDIRRINSSTYKSGEGYYYFISNKIDADNNYVMEFIKSEDDTYIHQLNSDEYFFVTDLNKSSYEIVGNNTLVKLYAPNISEDKITLESNRIDYVDIATNGIDAFKDSCILNTQYNITLQEQQLYNFVNGNILTFTKQDSSVKDISFTTNSYTLIDPKQINLTYQTDDTSASQSLPQLHLNENAMWKGTAILNINCDYDMPQFISSSDKSTQTITIGQNIYPDNTSGVYMLTSATVLKTGGTNVDVSYLDAMGERHSVDVLIYSAIAQAADWEQKNLSMVYTNDALPVGSTTVNLGVSISPNYQYIVKVTIDNKNVSIDSSKPFVLGGVPSPLGDVQSDNSNISYYQVIPSEDTRTKIEFTLNNSNESATKVSVTLSELIPITSENMFAKYNINTNDITETMKNLCLEGYNNFKFDYKVPSNIVIEDPLEGYTFFNNLHECNDYAIPYAQLATSNINVLNTRG